jgi:hypothetical protein
VGLAAGMARRAQDDQDSVDNDRVNNAAVETATMAAGRIQDHDRGNVTAAVVAYAAS